METIGKFEFNRKELIGHGAFAVVFKGRHKQKRDFEVAVKCINKKNLAKSQSLFGKEIKILKELKHENIVGLLDYQETGGCVYLVMEYCNGGDLAEYLHSKGTLSEDTIRVFLQQIAQAMKVLQSKGILHRDLKPQNILLCHPEGRRSSLNNICIKIADFGFARHLQTNTMAATLCGSPMYMAPEVITSQTYDAKADLWSIGTIVFQCLTGKAPFQASTPQELRLFYESNRKLLPSIPRETSSHLRHLLLGLLQRNHKDRMDFNVFFHHPFLDSSGSMKKSSPVPMLSYRSSGSGSSSSGSSTSHMASPQHSNGEMQRLQPPGREPPPGFPLKDTASEDSGNASSDAEDYVMVPTEFPSEFPCEIGDGLPVEGSLMYSGTSLMAEKTVGTAGRTPPSSPCLRSPSNLVCKPAEFSNYSQSVPVPVPTQIRNYQRMAQNQQPAGLNGSTRVTLCPAGARGACSPGTGRARPLLFSPAVGMTPGSSEQMTPIGTRVAGSPGTQQGSCYRQQIQRRNLNSTQPGSQGPMALPWLPSRRQTVPDLQTLAPGLQTMLARTKDKALPWLPSRRQTVPDLQTLTTGLQTILIRKKGPFKRSLSTGRVSDMLLRAACGAQLMTGGSDECLCSEKAMDTTAPPGGCDRVSASPAAVAFTFGSPSREISPPNFTACRRFSVGSPSHASPDWPLSSRLLQRGAHREADREVMDATPACSLVFHPPELPEDTLMEQPHTDALGDLRFTLAFVLCVMEMASSKDPGLETPDASFLEQSLVADRISLLSREWSYAEQLVLYMKAEEFLSAALHAAKEDIKQGRLIPSATVKQVVRRLNELYKTCVTSCRSLNGRLYSFLLDKQRLMDCFNGIAAEKIIYNNTVHMVQSAALDEMFHRGQASVQRYHKALLLMEGLSRIMMEQEDIDTIDKCKECIERRLSALQMSPLP